MNTATRLGIRKAMVEVVAAERERQGLSRRALCERAGISNSVVQHFEDMGRDVRFTTLAQLAKGLGMPLWTLVREAEDALSAEALERGE